jgi:hypothetical protein
VGATKEEGNSEMPKAEMIDRMRISFDTDVPEMGAYVATLTKMGAQNLRYELVTEVHTYKNKTNHETPASDFLTEWIKDHPTFKAIEAVKAFRADGRGDGNVAYPTLTRLVEMGILKKVGPGEYARSDQKALPAPEKKAKKVEQKHFDKPGTEIILSDMRRSHGRTNTTRLTEIFVAQGRAKNSVSASLAKLVSQKMIKRVGDVNSGQYQLLSKGQTPRKKKILEDKPAVKSNGNGKDVAELVTEATHGA